MKDKILKATKTNFKIASNCLKRGGVIVTPSDTNLALTLDPWDDSAVKRAFTIKNRSDNAPLTLFFLHPADWMLYSIAKNNRTIEKLIRTFWPGPLNIILEAKESVPAKILCGGSTVSMGCLRNPTWRGFMEEYRKPVTMTSANLSGQADGVLVDMDTVIEQVAEKVDYILEGSAQGTTTSSTIVDMTSDIPVIIRIGDVTPSDIEKAIGIKPKINLVK